MRQISLRSIHQEERGIASFIVVLTLMFIISLIVLGFAQIVRRNQQQVLDRNLSTRAFYVAESGVNIAAQRLKVNPNLYPTGKTSCAADTNITAADYTIDGPSGAQLTCLTIDNTPFSLEYSNVAKQSSQIIPLEAASGSFSSVTFSYQSTTPATNYPACTASPTLPADSGWTCSAPMLRIDLVPSGGAALARNTLLSNTYTVFVYPRSGGVNAAGTTTYSAGANNQGVFANALCNQNSTPRHCRVTITGLSGIYTARVMSIYDSANLSVCANSGAASCNVRLRGAQAVVDATGKAVDVVRRIQVRLSLFQDTMAPNFAVEAGAGLCKRYYLAPGIPQPIESNEMDGSPVDLTDATHPCAL